MDSVNYALIAASTRVHLSKQKPRVAEPNQVQGYFELCKQNSL